MNANSFIHLWFGNEICIYTELVRCYYNVYDEFDYIEFAVESI